MKSLTNIDTEEDESAMVATPSGRRLSSKERAKKKGFFGKLKKMFSRQDDELSDLEMRGIREMARRTPTDLPESETAGIGPASPTAQWKNEWDEEDGPMPPGMEFSFNADEKRKKVMLKILDL